MRHLLVKTDAKRRFPVLAYYWVFLEFDPARHSKPTHFIEIEGAREDHFELYKPGGFRLKHPLGEQAKRIGE